MSNFSKPAISIEGQIDVLKSRGLMVDDSQKAAHYLKYLGYYGLKGYGLFFEKDDIYPINLKLQN